MSFVLACPTTPAPTTTTALAALAVFIVADRRLGLCILTIRFRFRCQGFVIGDGVFLVGGALDVIVLTGGVGLASIATATAAATEPSASTVLSDSSLTSAAISSSSGRTSMRSSGARLMGRTGSGRGRLTASAPCSIAICWWP